MNYFVSSVFVNFFKENLISRKSVINILTKFSSHKLIYKLSLINCVALEALSDFFLLGFVAPPIAQKYYRFLHKYCCSAQI